MKNPKKYLKEELYHAHTAKNKEDFAIALGKTPLHSGGALALGGADATLGFVTVVVCLPLPFCWGCHVISRIFVPCIDRGSLKEDKKLFKGAWKLTKFGAKRIGSGAKKIGVGIAFAATPVTSTAAYTVHAVQRHRSGP